MEARMAELKQHAWLLALLTLLAFAKFFIVPVFEWQDRQLAEIKLLDKKQHKISTVLKEKDNITKLNKKLETILEQVDGFISPYQDEAKFKLNQQKMLESLLAKFNLTTQHVGWQAARPEDEFLLTRYPILIRFSGKTTDVISFLAATDMNPQRIEVNEFNFSLKGQREKSVGRINGSVTLFLFMEQESNVNLVLKPYLNRTQSFVQANKKQSTELFEPVLFKGASLC